VAVALAGGGIGGVLAAAAAALGEDLNP
jgi:hypothetical protein